MSGFVVLCHLDGAPVDPSRLDHLTHALAFRGPDAQRAACPAPHLGFGQALLRSTFESEHETQPLTFDEKIWIVGDLRLDARPELLARLRAANLTPRLNDAAQADSPDVALALLAYHAWGEACVDYLHGDWGFVIWEAARQKLFGARDQFGVVPVYYAQTPQHLIISNTLQCLRQHPAVSSRLNQATIGDYLLFGTNWNRATTFFTDLQRLPPAHTLILADGQIRLRRYWQLSQPDYIYRRESDYIDQFRALFDQAVADRLRTDHLSTHLTGGMDSSSIAATAALLLKQSGQPFDLRAYTIVFERLIPDEEGKYARLTAEQYQLPITYLVAENYIGQPLPEKLVYLSPEPFALPGQTAEEDQKRRASAHSRVMLAGYGGDPLFGPAPSYLWGLLARGQVTAWGRAVAAHWRIHHRRPPLYIRHWLNYRRLPAELRLPVWLKADFVARQCLAERFRDIWLQNQAEDNRASMSESPFWSNLFGRADPGFTGVPLKFRFPFFDQRLVEFILTVPPVPWFTDKHLLRAAISNRISLTVLQRPKTPLASQPHGQQARQVGSPEWMKKLAGEGGLEPYVNREQLAQLVAEPGRLKPWQYSQLYLPITFAYWLKQGDLL